MCCQDLVLLCSLREFEQVFSIIIIIIITIVVVVVVVVDKCMVL